MTTIGQVIDRAYRDYLTPPGEQPSRFLVGSGGIDDSSAALPVDLALLSPEEQAIIGLGTQIEVVSVSTGGELMLVEATSGGPPPTSLTVRRNMFDTGAAAHIAGDLAYIAGDDYMPRHSVFVATADAIEALWPDLWTIRVDEVPSGAGPIELADDVKEVVDVRRQSGSRWPQVTAWDEIHDFPLTSTGIALQTYGQATAGMLQVYYKVSPIRPEAEDDLLEDLGVAEGWVKAVVVGAVAQLVANKDIDASTIDFITEALEAEGFKVGAGTDVRNSLLQFHRFLMTPLKRALHYTQRDRVIHEKSY